jgi:hypothetical protein
MLQINTDFTITVEASEGSLIVTLRFPAAAEQRLVEWCMAEVARAFRTIEPFTDVELRGLYWRQQRISDVEDSVQLRKAFTDPDYPGKFDAALKATRLNFVRMVMH